MQLVRRTLVVWRVRTLDAACVVAVQSRTGLGFVSGLGVFPYRVCPDCPRRTRGAMLRPCLVRKASRRDSSGPPKAGRFLWCEPLTHPVSALPGSALIRQHIARLRRLPRPVRERKDPQRHEVHQRYQYQQRPPLREAGSQQDLPHRDAYHDQGDQQAEQSAHQRSPSLTLWMEAAGKASPAAQAL